MNSAPHIRSGKLRHSAALQIKVEVPDAAGGIAISSWSTERQMRCLIRPISGTQRLEGMRRESEVTHEITTRYNSDVTTGKRLLHRGVAYNIEAVFSPDEYQQWLHIIASSGVAT